MEEYKIISGLASECQRRLNQWKHTFDLEILQMSANKDTIVILLIRNNRTSDERTSNEYDFHVLADVRTPFGL